jgi:hypothetical protein
MRFAILLALLAGCSASSPPASPASAPAAPSSAAASPASAAARTGSIPELAYFVGRWHAEAHDPSTGKRFELDYTVAPALRGAWYFGTGFVAALDLELHDVWGKDPVTGEIVRTIFDSARTTGTVRSRGWSGDVLILEGTAVTTGGSAPVRETIRRVGPDEFHAVWETRTGDAWTAYSVEKLRRQRPR